MNKRNTEEGNIIETFLVSTECSEEMTDGSIRNFNREFIVQAGGFDDAEFKAMDAVWSDNNSVGVHVHTITLTDIEIIK